MTSTGGPTDPSQSPYGMPYPSMQPEYGQPYGQPPWGPPPKTGTNGLAVASLVLGILPVAGIGAILAIVFGLVARGQIDRSAQTGRGLATAGAILGTLWILAFIALIIFAVTHHGHACVGTPGYCPQN